MRYVSSVVYFEIFAVTGDNLHLECQTFYTRATFDSAILGVLERVFRSHAVDIMNENVSESSATVTAPHNFTFR